jgi:hypothetical protein
MCGCSLRFGNRNDHRHRPSLSIVKTHGHYPFGGAGQRIMIASRLLATLCAATAASSFLLPPAHGQTRLTTLSVDDPRPLEAAVLALIKRYPLVITHEDPRYEFSGDMQDVSSRNPRVQHRVLIPLGGVLQANYRISGPGPATQPP